MIYRTYYTHWSGFNATRAEGLARVVRMEGFGVSCAVRLVGLYEISARAGKKADGLRQRLGVVPCYIPPRRRLTTDAARK